MISNPKFGSLKFAFSENQKQNRMQWNDASPCLSIFQTKDTQISRGRNDLLDM